MKKLLAILITLAFCVSAPVMAQTLSSAKSQGLTTVSYMTSTVQRGGLWYECLEWTLGNNTSNTAPLVSLSGGDYAVLVDELFLFNAGSPVVAFAESPNSEWTFNSTSSRFERYRVEPNQKYWAPPSVGPTESLSGFKLYYLKATQDAQFSLPTDYAPLTHVLAVLPAVDPTVPQLYTATSVSFLSSLTGQVESEGTWYDKPDDTSGGNPNEPTIPEASTLLLAAVGMIGPAGYLRMRRRA